MHCQLSCPITMADPNKGKIPKEIFACGNPACPLDLYFPKDDVLDHDHTNRVYLSESPFFDLNTDGRTTDPCGQCIKIKGYEMVDKKGRVKATLEKVGNRCLLTVKKGEKLSWITGNYKVGPEAHLRHPANVCSWNIRQQVQITALQMRRGGRGGQEFLQWSVPQHQQGAPKKLQR